MDCTYKALDKIATTRAYVEKKDFEQSLKKVIAMQVESYNQESGSLNEQDNIDCNICKNKGFMAKLSVDESKRPMQVLKKCECMKKRKLVRELALTGMINLKNKNFDNFKITKTYQKSMLDSAKENVEKDNWYFIGGQSGAGKTHICSAILNASLEKYSYKVKYWSWEQGIRELKLIQTEYEIFSNKIAEIENTKLLLIDDLFKVGDGFEVSRADIQMTFSIINYRYNNNLKTVISSEKTFDELNNTDEAITGRIAEKCGKYLLNLGKDKTRNFRLKNIFEKLLG